MSAGPSPQQAAQAIQSASQQYGVPTEILVGIYGAESTYGTAYANGGTTYGYFGLTSPGLWSPSDSFQDDADIAARTIKSNYDQHGHSWDAALQAYSGGGYGLGHVQAMAAGAPAALKAILSGSAPPGSGSGGSAGSAPSGGSSGGTGGAGGALGTLGSIAGVPVEYVLLGVGGVLVLVLAMWVGGVTI